MKSITIDYKHFEKSGFDSKNCSVVDIQIPKQKKSTKVMVYDTASTAPIFQNQANTAAIVTFTVEFLPFIQGKELVSKADDIVKDVLKDGYDPQPCTICTHKKDGEIDTKRTIDNVIIQKVQLFLNRKNERKGEMGYIRMLFTLQGIQA